MRAELGPIALNGVFVITGFTVLAALGLVRPGPGGACGGLALGFLTGIAAVGLTLIVGLIAGLPVTAPGLLIVAGAITAAAVAAARRRGDVPWRSWLPRGAPPGRPDLALVVLVVAIAAAAVIGAVGAVDTPLSAYDAWALWTSKAEMLTNAAHLPTAYFTSHVLGAWQHPTYPLLWPLLESMWFRFAGVIDTRAVHLEAWLLLLGFVAGAAELLARRGRAVLWAPPLLLVLLARTVVAQTLTGYADIPMAALLALGILALAHWLEHPSGIPWLALLLLGAATQMKAEGLPFAAIAVLSAAAVAHRAAVARRGLLALALGLAATAAPWLIWTSAHHVVADPDIRLSTLLDPGALIDRLPRLGQALSTTTAGLADVTGWLLVVPLGLATAIACLITGRGRRSAAFLLLSGALTYALIMVVYWESPVDINFYLLTSAGRTPDATAFVAVVAAALLVTGDPDPRATLPTR